MTMLGHRARLKERFLQAYGTGMHEYEMLELLLTFAIPRKDVKPLAKNLMVRFKNLQGVLDAAVSDLKLIEGMGSHSTVLIKLVKELGGLYLAGKMEQRNVLTSPQSVIHFSRMKLAGLSHEAFMVIFLNVQNEILCHEIVNEGTIDQVAVYPRRIIEKALGHHAAGLIIVHNHPSGATHPSEEDKQLTRSLKQAAQLFSIRILDHLIVSQNGYFSFLEGGMV